MRVDPDPRLAADSMHLGYLELCEVRLMDDSRWPWLILVPQREGLTELHDLSPGDREQVAVEVAFVSQKLKTLTGALKINTGALGNIVRQLHLHVIARNEGDPNWPGPVWGHGARLPYTAEERMTMSALLAAQLFVSERPNDKLV